MLESELAGQLEREPVRVVQPKRVLARYPVRTVLEHLVEEPHPGRERLGESFLLRAEHRANIARFSASSG